MLSLLSWCHPTCHRGIRNPRHHHIVKRAVTTLGYCWRENHSHALLARWRFLRAAAHERVQQGLISPRLSLCSGSLLASVCLLVSLNAGQTYRIVPYTIVHGDWLCQATLLKSMPMRLCRMALSHMADTHSEQGQYHVPAPSDVTRP